MVATIKDEMKWLVLGSGGQLGRAMRQELTQRDNVFLALDRTQLDITDRNSVSELVETFNPNVIVNAAAWTNVDLAEAEEESAYLVNAIGPKNLAIASSRVGAKLVQISTDYVFSGLDRNPREEEQLTAPLSAYGRTKVEGERFVVEICPSSSYIIRTAWLYGEWGRNFAKTMARLALFEDRTVKVVGDQFGQPTNVMDLAARICETVERDLESGIYHGTNVGEASWYEFAKEIFAQVGADSSRVSKAGTSDFQRPAARPSYSVLGQQHWLTAGMDPMRPWKEALSSILPSIVNQVKIEEQLHGL